jgi:hypothetical protein
MMVLAAAAAKTTQRIGIEATVHGVVFIRAVLALCSEQ